MHNGLRSTRASMFRILTLAAFLTAATALSNAQDISGYTIRAEHDVFTIATMDALAASSGLPDMPVLDCAIEYLRRGDGSEIVYRRGPIALQQHSPMRKLDELYGRPSQPAVEGDYSQKSSFVGGMIVDLPKPGEVASTVSAGGDMQYMMRVAVIPKSYKRSTLTAEIFIERAVVYLHGDTIDIHNSEVFSRTVQLTGNQPLNFAMPAWEVIGTERMFRYMPKTLEEDLMVTLETPYHFGFSNNYPDPFSNKTRITYAVPTEAQILLTISVEGEEEIVDKGLKAPGIHHLVWNADDVPDGVYTATLSARDPGGQELHSAQMQLHKTSGGMNYPMQRQVSLFSLLPNRLRISTESGIGYQFPTDAAQSMRNMFTHIGVRVGYQVSEALEFGVIFGQEAFHEYPSENVDIDRIADYGGVVGYKYGFGGGYARYLGTLFGFRSITQATLAFTNEAPVADFGFGIGAELFPQIDVFLIPAVTAHFKDEISTKVGFQYGLRARF